MQTPTAPRVLVAASRRAHEGSAPQRAALRSAGDLPPIAARAQAHEATAVGAVEAADTGVDDGPPPSQPSTPGPSRATLPLWPTARTCARWTRRGGPGPLASERLGLSDSNDSPLLPHPELQHRLPLGAPARGTQPGDLRPLPRSRTSRAAFACAAARGRGDSGGSAPRTPLFLFVRGRDPERPGHPNRISVGLHQARWRSDAVFTGIQRFSTAINTRTSLDEEPSA